MPERPTGRAGRQLARDHRHHDAPRSGPARRPSLLVVLAFAAARRDVQPLPPGTVPLGALQGRPSASRSSDHPQAPVVQGLHPPPGPRYGEPRLIVIGVVTLGLGSSASPCPQSVPPPLAGSTLIVGVGQGLASPTVTGSSRGSPPIANKGPSSASSPSAQTLCGWQLRRRQPPARPRGPAAPFWEAAAPAPWLSCWPDRRPDLIDPKRARRAPGRRQRA